MLALQTDSAPIIFNELSNLLDTELSDERQETKVLQACRQNHPDEQFLQHFGHQEKSVFAGQAVLELLSMSEGNNSISKKSIEGVALRLLASSIRPCEVRNRPSFSFGK